MDMSAVKHESCYHESIVVVIVFSVQNLLQCKRKKKFTNIINFVRLKSLLQMLIINRFRY